MPKKDSKTPPDANNPPAIGESGKAIELFLDKLAQLMARHHYRESEQNETVQAPSTKRPTRQ